MPHVIAALATLVLFVTAAAAPATAHAQPDPIVAIIEEEAAAYGVSAAWLLAVARCENPTLDPYAVGAAGEVGIAQWHVRGIWWSTPAGRQGLPRPYGNPRLDIAMMAWAFAHGLSHHWSCAR